MRPNIDEENNYSVKLKYCPGKRRNVVIKTMNGINNEICMDGSECLGHNGCAHGYTDDAVHLN